MVLISEYGEQQHLLRSGRQLYAQTLVEEREAAHSWYFSTPCLSHLYPPLNVGQKCEKCVTAVAPVSHTEVVMV
jgi:hypothetical protein